MSTVNYDVAFIGNGILAVSTALRLLDKWPKLKIVIIGSPKMHGAASIAAGAMLGCFGEVTKYTFASQAAVEKFAMCRLARDMWSEWIHLLNSKMSSELSLRSVLGTIVLENSSSGFLDEENFNAILSALNRYDEPYETISRHDISGFNPVPTARPFRALFLPKEGSIDAVTVHNRICRILKLLKVSFVHSSAKEILVSKGRAYGVKASKGNIVRSDKVVCAAGAFTTKLLDAVTDRKSVQPVFSGTGISLVVDRQPQVAFKYVVRTVNRGGSCGLHIIPIGRGHHYVGATNALFSAPQFQASAGLSHFLLQCAIDQLDQSIATSRVVEWRVGNRPVSLDTYPLLGWTDVSHLYVMTGTYRDGFHASPLISKIAAHELLGVKGGYAHPFRAIRRPISTMSAQDSSTESIYHAMSTGFEASLVLPRLWRHETLAALFADVVKNLYKRLNTKQGLSPDIVPLLATLSMGTEEEQKSFNRVCELIQAVGLSNDLERH